MLLESFIMPIFAYIFYKIGLDFTKTTTNN